MRPTRSGPHLCLDEWKKAMNIQLVIGAHLSFIAGILILIVPRGSAGLFMTCELPARSTSRARPASRP
jgi:hypothetical protein